MGSTLKVTLITSLLLSACQTNIYTPLKELPSSIEVTESEISASPILYHMRKQAIPEAIKLYQNQHKNQDSHDFELIKQMSTFILEQGMQERNPENLLSTLFGLSLSGDQNLIPLVNHTLEHRHPQLQIASLNLLASLDDERAVEALIKAIQSPSLMLKLESAYHLAHKKRGYKHILNLMHKIEPELLPIFPHLFAMIGGEESAQTLRVLLNDSNPEVRLQTILSIGQFQRDDLLNDIHDLTQQMDPLQQEACIFTLGQLKDHQSISFLEQLSNSPLLNIQLSSSYVLYQFGKKKYSDPILAQAGKGNLFAISLLKNVDESIDLLTELVQNPQMNIRLNATLALLKHRDPRAIRGLREILIQDQRDFAFQSTTSQSGTIQAWQAIPSAGKQRYFTPFSLEVSLSFREQVLSDALNLPEETFLTLARELFASSQKALIPTLVGLLENLGTDKAIELLKYEQQHVGSPLIRTYCTLALFRLEEEGPYEEQVKIWVKQHLSTKNLRFRPLLPWTPSSPITSFSLTPNEEEQLLVNALLTLANTHQEEHTDFIIQALADASIAKRSMLAGILIHSSM